MSLESAIEKLNENIEKLNESLIGYSRILNTTQSSILGLTLVLTKGAKSGIEETENEKLAEETKTEETKTEETKTEETKTDKTKIYPNVEKPKSKKSKEVPSDSPPISDFDDEFEDEDEDLTPEVKNYTSQELKTLAKNKISQGTDRTKVKSIIVSLGAESIADLDQDGINTCYEKISKL